MGHELHPAHALEPGDDAGQPVCVVAHARPGAGIADRDHPVAARLERRLHAVHRMARPAEPVHEHDHVGGLGSGVRDQPVERTHGLVVA